ncbi:MAG: hypothetical protein PHH69_01750 [Candidatus Omnitrophica bacterium]|nr:hypothetical protein [Candidatus Omnitrophota bacterium]MDD5610253.1 hypothetical protein [Candidatus Omnitrophota bacterium]
MPQNLLLNPPVTFLAILAASLLLTQAFKRLSFKRKAGEDRGAEMQAYSCGEDFKGHMIQPDYSQFFPFAFFFTILHVVALMIATVPAETVHTFTIATLYILGSVIGLIVLLRK